MTVGSVRGSLEHFLGSRQSNGFTLHTASGALVGYRVLCEVLETGTSAPPRRSACEGTCGHCPLWMYFQKLRVFHVFGGILVHHGSVYRGLQLFFHVSVESGGMCIPDPGKWWSRRIQVLESGKPTFRSSSLKSSSSLICKCGECCLHREMAGGIDGDLVFRCVVEARRQ